MKSRFITSRMAQENPAYWQLVGHAFQEQAARVLQRRFRRIYAKKHGLIYQIKRDYQKPKFSTDTCFSGTDYQTLSKNILTWHYLNANTHQTLGVAQTYHETLNLRVLRLPFLQEPLDEAYKTHVDCIHQDKWTELNFEDPEFVRNIYKALRLKTITLNQLGTALLLYFAKNDYRHSAPTNTWLSQLSLMEADDYINLFLISRKGICLSSLERKMQLMSRVSVIPPEDHCTFMIDLPRDFSAFLLYILLNRRSFFSVFSKNSMFIQELARRYVYQQKCEKLYYCFETAALFLEHLSNIVDLIEMRETFANNPGFFPSNSSDKLYLESLTNFLLTLILLDDHIPMMTLSTRYVVTNPKSPTLSIVLPTLALLNIIQDVLQGPHATQPYLTAGAVSAEMIRELDQKSYGAPFQKRAVELYHPDLAQSLCADGYRVDKFIMSIHDLFHCFRNGYICTKPLFRYLRSVIDVVSDPGMSPTLWELCDMDFNADDLSDPLEKVYLDRFCNIAKRLENKHSHNHIIEFFFIDWILSPRRWQFLDINFSFESQNTVSWENKELVDDLSRRFHALQKTIGLIRPLLTSRMSEKSGHLLCLLSYLLHADTSDKSLFEAMKQLVAQNLHESLRFSLKQRLYLQVPTNLHEEPSVKVLNDYLSVVYETRDLPATGPSLAVGFFKPEKKGICSKMGHCTLI